MIYVCDRCGGPLKAVLQSATSPLNAEQFDSAKAGDFYCEKYPGNGRGHAPFRYFWKSELERQVTFDSQDRYRPTLIEACKAVLLFHAGAPWNELESDWNRCTQGAEATTKGLCDMVRRAIERAEIEAVTRT